MYLPSLWPALLSVLAPPLELSETPTTRLFVQTVPPGAAIILDDKPLGQSNGLFLVSPGVRKITVELDGYYPEGQQVRLPEGWITRVELELRRLRDAPDRKGKAAQKTAHPDRERPIARGDPKAAKVASDAASKAMTAYVTGAEIPEPIREAMMTVLRQHPSETRWSGRSGPAMFAMAGKSLPAGQIRQRAVPALLDLAHMLAVQELLKAKSLLDRYAATGLTDATTLRQAVEEAAGRLHVTGKVKGCVHQATAQGEFAVAHVIAEETALTAHLLEPAELEKVQAAYRDVMHRQARELMDRQQWNEALLLWLHLHQRRLVSQKLYLDAAQCFKELGQEQDVVRVLTEAIDSFGEQATAEFLEAAGDMALDVQTEPAQALAEKAYRAATSKLLNTFSVPEPQTSDDQ